MDIVFSLFDINQNLIIEIFLECNYGYSVFFNYRDIVRIRENLERNREGNAFNYLNRECIMYQRNREGNRELERISIIMSYVVYNCVIQRLYLIMYLNRE